MRRAMLGAGMLGILFLAGQLLLWREFVAGRAITPRPIPANAFFYLITALHGLHIAGGLFFWGRAVLRLRGGRRRPAAGRAVRGLLAFPAAGLGADAGAADFDLSERE